MRIVLSILTTKMQHKCLVIVLLLAATTAYAEILFNFPPPLAGAYPFYVHRYSGTPTDPNLPPNVPLTGKMATVLNNDSYGEIVLTTYDRLFTRQLTSILFAKLPKAIVVIPPFPDFPGFEQYTHDDYFEQPKLWNIPIGSIHFQTGMKAWAILADNMTADVTLVFQANPWQTFADNPSWILIGPVLISGMVLFAFGLSIARLHQFVRAEGFKVTVAQVTLIIQIIINPLIAWWWLVDPAKTRMVIPNQVDNVVEAGTQTAAVTVCIYLGIFFWQELLSKTAIRVAVFVNKLKVPMILVVVAVLLLEYASSVVFTVASMDPSQITQTFTKVRYGIDMALVGITFIYYTIVSIQVMVYIRKMKSGTKDVKRATIRFAIVGFAQLLRVLSDIFPLDEMYIQKTGMLLVLDPVVFRLGHHWLRYLSIAITNLALVSGFRVPQRRGQLTASTTRTGLSSSA